MLKEAYFCRDEKKYSLVPVDGKVPAVPWKEYCERFPTDQELEAWFANTCYGIALVTGRLSNVTVLDADTPKADAWIAKNAFTQEVLRTPSGGHHYHFEFYDYPNRTNLLGIGLDVRSEGGLAVLPPSEGYKWISQGTRGKIGDILPKIEPVKRERVVFEEPVEKVILRTRNYVAQIDGAVSGQGGHKQAYKVACKIADRLSHVMTPEEALPLMEEWNQRCSPPWSVAEMLHKLTDSWSRA